MPSNLNVSNGNTIFAYIFQYLRSLYLHFPLLIFFINGTFHFIISVLLVFACALLVFAVAVSDINTDIKNDVYIDMEFEGMCKQCLSQVMRDK